MVVAFSYPLCLDTFGYASGLPVGFSFPILTLGSLLGFSFGLSMPNWLYQHICVLFLVLGMAGYFWGYFKSSADFSIILVTEMVGDFRQLMTIAVVTLVAYIVMDLLKGEPIYEAMFKFIHSKRP